MYNLKAFLAVTLFALAGTTTQAYADEETIDLSAQEYSNGTQYSSTTGTNVTLTYGDGTNDGKYYDTGTGIRIYGEGHMTVSVADGYKMTEIVVTCDNATASKNKTYPTTTDVVDTGTLTLSDATSTWTGEATSVTYTRPSGGGHWRIQKVQVTYESTGDASKTNTKVAFANASYSFDQGDTGISSFTGQTATLTDADDNAVTGTLAYESSNTDVATVNASTGAVSLTGTTGTTTIKATFAGDDTYNGSSASYTITIVPVCENIAALTALTSGTEAKLMLTNAIVTYVNGSRHYLEDASGAILVYMYSGFDYTAGQVLNGKAAVTYTLYYSLPELTAFTADGEITVTSGTVAATEMSVEDALKAENYSKYVKMTGATVASGKVTDGTNTLTLHDLFSQSLTFTTNGIYNIVGIPNIYGSTHELAVISFEPVVVDQTVTIGETGYATLYYGTQALTVPTGVEAYTYSNVEDSKLTVSKTYTEGDVIAKGTAVVVKGTAGDYTFGYSTEDGTGDTDNLLKGTDEAATTTGGEVYYMLSTDSEGENVGFYYGATDGAAFTNGAHKAYLPLTSAQAGSIRAFILDGGQDATAITTATTARETGKAYDLQGRRVATPTKGLYILNGKKIIK